MAGLRLSSSGVVTTRDITTRKKDKDLPCMALARCEWKESDSS
jgi:hypothetical protein